MKRFILGAAACGILTHAYSQDITGRYNKKNDPPI